MESNQMDSKESEIEALSRKLCETARYILHITNKLPEIVWSYSLPFNPYANQNVIRIFFKLAASVRMKVTGLWGMRRD